MSKNRLPRVFDDLGYLNVNMDENDVERAMKSFIYNLELKKVVPSELQCFIAEYLKVQLSKGNCKVASSAKAGRRGEVSSNSYYNMLAWYRFYCDSRYNEIPKANADGRLQEIADSFLKSDQQVTMSLILDDREARKCDTCSETTIKRAVKAFNENGFYMPTFVSVCDVAHKEVFSSTPCACDNCKAIRARVFSLALYDVHNQIQMETFCRYVLKIEDTAEIDRNQKSIIEQWLANKFKAINSSN